ncbi:MAG: hypothetical protein ACSLFR_10390 [Solirubrobacteraceae bacterium]
MVLPHGNHATSGAPHVGAAQLSSDSSPTTSTHQADHEARHTATYAALAKSLNLQTSAVQAAFEAVRPARPAK